MEVYVFKTPGLSVGVRWKKGKAQEIILNPGGIPESDSNIPPEVERFFADLSAYLEGKDVKFSLPIDTDILAPFARKVSEELAKTSRGEVISYAELARRAGHPEAARAVGRVMSANPFPLVIPCHRVLGSDGSLTGFSAGIELKRRLLELEGHTYESG
ncbi:methylated-DNA--[protein]-cysteine S-methyltransferase [candidate division WOR-3 bacterium]|uniref:methylated-DNA--[protein]-cysteine S-methyltransferase n=1 Tax=candidate division WOR-3 bacterium TaxID=2052148 RepID=A0A9D5KCP5_UNCW3|nr:methylated-DNA--[protein]-cysteine S-methyltransferase [candidate division WOR-3 bacterium]MBD3365211.1 methylated-DNA--[protein]-cysteine S-methyltransferase [candidate division WOR-3 bacterium]